MTSFVYLGLARITDNGSELLTSYSFGRADVKMQYDAYTLKECMLFSSRETEDTKDTKETKDTKDPKEELYIYEEESTQEVIQMKRVWRGNVSIVYIAVTLSQGLKIGLGVSAWEACLQNKFGLDLWTDKHIKTKISNASFVIYPFTIKTKPTDVPRRRHRENRFCFYFYLLFFSILIVLLLDLFLFFKTPDA
jgi:hypothetical protein